MGQPISEQWLVKAGFKWHQLERQPDKHWLLWLGDAVRDGNAFTATEDLGVEIAPGPKGDDRWYCWVRSDSAHRYSRFLHIRHLRFVHELIALIEALTGQRWDPANNAYGAMLTIDQAVRARRDRERLDQRLTREGHPWSSVERDDTRGRALPEHLEAHAKPRGEDKA